MQSKPHTLFLALAASALAHPAFAEEQDLVVTATPAPTLSARLPARVDVIDRHDIESRGLVTLTEALGASAVQAGGFGQQASLFLRGANSKHALALFDGVRLNDASTPNGQYDFGLDGLGALERVEVLRGPASSVYGSDAIGGVVNLIPRRGGDGAFEPFLELEAGSFETFRTVAGAAGATPTLAYGVSVESLRTEGFDLIPARMSTVAGEPDGAHLSTATLAARTEGGAWGFDVLGRWRQTTSEFDTFSAGAFFDLRSDDPDLQNETEQTLWRLGGDYASASGARVRAEAGAVGSDRVERDGGAEASSAQSLRSFANLSADGVAGGATLRAGISFEREAIDTRPQFASPLSVDEDHLSAYLIAQRDFTQRLALTGSVRVDDYESFGVQTTYSAGAVAFFGPLRVFAAHGAAFKAPSLSERFEVSFFNVGNPALLPEQSTSWEIGADWRANDEVRLGVSYYSTDISDLIEYRFAELRNVNIASAEIEGAEAYAAISLAARANVRLDYAWTDARNGETGARLARRPEHAWSITADVTVSERVALSARWRFVGERVDVLYDDAGAFVNANGETPGFEVGDLTLRFALDERAEVTARVTNVTDEVYEQPNAFAGAPRSFHLGLRARY
jgi:vitamin B12 transporter